MAEEAKEPDKAAFVTISFLLDDGDAIVAGDVVATALNAVQQKYESAELHNWATQMAHDMGEPRIMFTPPNQN